MGTRATITHGQKVFLTHWDGYPESLGARLVDVVKKGTLTAGKLRAIAKEHLIDGVTTPTGLKTKFKDWFFDYHYKIVGKKVFIKGYDSYSEWRELK